ncbi:MAG: valine--tRNA ligase [Candidatus Saccharimonadia bacterium]
MNLDKSYEPAKYEQDIYALWEKSGAFSPIDDPKAEAYCILMPPPNANADLHIGHSLTTTLEDIMIRHARMLGKATLFLPGADHAGFETQVVYERQLEKEGKSRFDFSPDELYHNIMDYVLANKSKMEDQQRRIGASVDWSKNTFTLDQKVIDRAYLTFKKLWDDDLLYRGKRIVNYCTKHNTSFSELEVVYENQQTYLWEIAYPIDDSEDDRIVVATTRPETIFGDTAVAVHPDDKRYAHLVGKFVHVPLTDRIVPIIADSAVDPKFGTGAVKVTPAHDPTDFEIGERHNLPQIQVIGTDGKMTSEVPKEYQNLDVKTAQVQISNFLLKDKRKHFLVKRFLYSNSVGHCYKCGTKIEPLILDQWLIRMKPLAQKALKVLEQEQIKIIPKSKRKELFSWLENIRDWNISRQIVWGIPIPAYLADDGEVIIDLESTDKTITKNGKLYHKDPDTFDTWFSSGQWPIVTLNYPDGEDFKQFYPTSVMETAGEIIFFWVARMIMLGLYLTDEIPFKTVYLHGLVLDPAGKKMSKSKGNVLAPLPLLERYGADALRMSLVANRSAGLNQGFDEKRVEANRNFANKLWNCSRFILAQLPEDFRGAADTAPTSDLSVADKWILSKVSKTVTLVSKDLGNYRFSDAQQKIYSLLWDDFADWYIETSKVDANLPVLLYCLETILKLAHPFAPFVTEAIWQKMSWHQLNLISSAWPPPGKTFTPELKSFTHVQLIIGEARELCRDMNLTQPTLLVTDKNLLSFGPIISKLAGIGDIKQVKQGRGLALVSTGHEAWLDVSPTELDQFLKKLRDNRTSKKRYIASIDANLTNPGFIKSAPKQIKQQQIDSKAEAQLLLSKLDEQISAIEASQS